MFDHTIMSTEQVLRLEHRFVTHPILKLRHTDRTTNPPKDEHEGSYTTNKYGNSKA